jgi:hypothetical protein
MKVIETPTAKIFIGYDPFHWFVSYKGKCMATGVDIDGKRTWTRLRRIHEVCNNGS